MQKNSKIEKLIKEAVDHLAGIIDVNLIVGKPINTLDGATVIPVSKVTFGFISGGGEYGEVDKNSDLGEYPFSGASGAVVSLKPSGFLIDKGDGLKVVQIPGDIYEKAIDVAEDFFKSFKHEK